MKIRSLLLVAICLGFPGLKAVATTHYVDINSTNPTPPYTNWATASTDIQSAIDISTNGDLILVTNGIYNTGGRTVPSNPLTNRVAVTKAVTVQSVNGPAETMIEGYQVPGSLYGANAVRCAFLTNNATLIGFTLTNGATYPPDVFSLLPQYNGGGVCCNASNSVISNCILIGNAAGNAGGAVAGGTLYHCTMMCSQSLYGGGAYGSTLYDCLLVSNTATAGGGVYGCNLANCLVIDNLASNDGGLGGGSFDSLLNNCTLAGNSSPTAGGVCMGTLNNCIVYDNSGGNYNTNSNIYPIYLNYCCTTPFPGPGFGIGNITSDPAFVNLAAGNFQIQSNSPCINAGNNAYVTAATDLAGNPRIQGGTVDIGAYEYQSPTSVISYAYLQQYGLPTDGSVDFTNFDGTPFNVYQDWVAGLNPTNPASVLVMLSPAATNNVSGISVSWESVSNILYNLQCSTNLPAFFTIQTNLTGQAGTTSYTDTTATNNWPYFYRVGVQVP